MKIRLAKPEDSSASLRIYGQYITAPNAKSEALHTALGLRLLGIFRNVGYKDGEWRDVLWFEKALGDYSPRPEPPLPIGEIAQELLWEIPSSIT